MKRIFVYGSLCKGMHHHDRLLAGRSRFLGEGYVKGALFALHDVVYPALLSGTDLIHGECYEVDEETAEAVDQLEEFTGDTQQDLYIRKECDIVNSVGAYLDHLPVYFYNLERNGAIAALSHQIEEHDYVQYMRRRKRKTKRYAVSSCLMNINCKYNGCNNANEALMQFLEDKDYICVCPEVLGGLSIPRASCEIVEGRIMNTNHEDCTRQFMEGADIAIEKILDFGADLVITQPRSPSCGAGRIYDGSFSGKLIQGNGVFVEKLMNEGIPVMSVDDFIDHMK